eukprot:TRINITY_DN16683_c0_g1_i1.p1 TRINITY_DN16683_c0_g1~~TRINITY_DN16683_c0_g1_i1.p1  ORF type:complete len:433 (-),score=86.09 TRINITY_DN16683_c0_g1_i1:254-1552(-)
MAQRRGGGGGGELRGIVDEGDEPPNDGRRANPGIDWDKTCAYKTFKIVRIRDRNLGLLYWGIVLLVVLYIAMVAFNIEGKHAQNDPGFGTTITRFKGKAFVKGTGAVLDGTDLRWPSIEPQGAFIMTRRILLRGQKRGDCVDMDSGHRCGDGMPPCPGQAACEDGHCHIKGWCPSLGDLNADDPPSEAVEEQLEGLENTMMQIVTSITFPGIGNKLYIAGDSSPRGNVFKNITLGEIVAMAEPPVKFEDIVKTGALIGINFLWSCDVNIDCEPTIVVKHLDANQGFVQKRAFHRREGGEPVRDAMYMWGIRILVESAGIGRRTSLVLIVIQLGSCLALLRTASICADFLMLQLYSKEKCEAYYRCKVIETPDFSDLQDRINLVQAHQKAQQERAEMLGRRQMATSSAGAAVPLGLGPGGRGGVGASILRGRM